MGFNGNNPDITLKNKVFKGTEGLYELIFKSKPNTSIITNLDRNNYRDMITLTNANRRHFNPNLAIKGTKA